MSTIRAARDGYSTSFVVPQSPTAVLGAVVDVRSWWTGEVEGTALAVGDEFTYRHPPQHYSVQRVVELDLTSRVRWSVLDSHLDGVSDPGEWTGSDILFEVTTVDGGTRLHFTHVGLVPDVECFGACSTAWAHYVGRSLHSLITSGRGLPDPF